MLGAPGRGEIRLKCTDAPFPEFPNMLFGQDEKTNKSFFDATRYLQSIESNASIPNFFTLWRTPISALCVSYGLNINELQYINEEGHILIEANLFCLFICFTNSEFLGYICNRMLDLLINGFTISDAYLTQCAYSRIPLETFIALFGNGEKNQSEPKSS